MRKLIILFTICLGCVLQGRTQQKEIQGVVEDAASHNPLPLATITIKVKGAPSSTRLTDSKGQFTLSVTPATLLSISYTGYKTQQDSIPAVGASIPTPLSNSTST